MYYIFKTMQLPMIRNAFPTMQEIQTYKELGAIFVQSGFLPVTVKTPVQAITIMAKGKELGLGPMQSFSMISVIQGKPTLSAEGMLAIIYRDMPNAVINFIQSDAKVCVIEAKRGNNDAFNKFSFTMDEAKVAGLTRNQTWTSYPTAMLRARCISSMARAKFPDCIAGCSYTPEELGGETDVSTLTPEQTYQKAKPIEPEPVVQVQPVVVSETSVPSNDHMEPPFNMEEPPIPTEPPPTVRVSPANKRAGLYNPPMNG
jgi:hypothetical protein